MPDILHRVGVLTPTPEKVYEALTTVDGLAGWWTQDTRGSGDPVSSLWTAFMSAGLSRRISSCIRQPSRLRSA